MSATRARLATLAAAAGYGPDALALIADAALPGTGPANDSTTAASPRSPAPSRSSPSAATPPSALADLVDSYRARYRDGSWRERFWRAQLRIAALRFNHPRFYGLSPCEADPARLAAHTGTPGAADERPPAPLAQAA